MASPNASRQRSRRRLFELAAICLAVAVAGGLIFPRLKPLIQGELLAQDQLIANGPRFSLAEDFVFVAIDEASVALDQLWPEDIAASPTLAEMTNEFPWPRSVYAAAITRILDAGAKVVVLDLLFNAPHRGDDALKRVIDAHADRVVLAANVSRADIRGQAKADAITPPHAGLIADPAADPRVGYANFWSDLDGTVRSAIYERPLIDLPGSPRYRSIASATLRQIGAGDLAPATDKPLRFRFGRTESLRWVPFYELFVPDAWTRNLRDGAIFKDKIVVIGPAAGRFQDYHRTPVSGRMEGPLVHINAIAAALRGDFYHPPPPGVSALITLLMAGIAFLIAVRIRHPLLALLAFIGVAVAYVAVVFVVFAVISTSHLLLAVLNPVLVLLVSGVICIAWNFARTRRESGRMRSMLERYISRNLVREVLDHREDFLSALGGTRRPMTVFFSDVRGFTSFSERADAGVVVDQLNEYLGEMVGVIFRHQGTVDKFMGDGIMAVWGNVISKGPAPDAEDAVSAALEMLERLARLNENWRARDLSTFTIGIGLHHGEAVFGNIGSAEKMEPTVIGDTVNLASRVEGLTKKYGVTLCVTASLADLVREAFVFRSVDLVQVVGKSRPIEILTVLGRRGDAGPEWLATYEAAVADFRARRFAEAAAQFRLTAQAIPDDKLCRIYLARCEAFLAEPPPEGWTGAEVATTK